jgi:ATP-binding cassette subfamily A (ABC1) protein 3
MKWVRWIFTPFPGFCGPMALFFIQGKLIINPKVHVLNFSLAGGNILMMAVDSVFYWVLLWLIEENFFRNPAQMPLKEETEAIDDDVVAEAKSVEASSPTDYQIRVKDLAKEYKGKVVKKAVRGVSFGVGFGECFALLGVNGAGKTTTFKSLTNEVIASSGELHIGGLNL